MGLAPFFMVNIMKNLKFIFVTLLTVCLSAGLTSCSDDDKGPGSVKDLIGEWQSVSHVSWTWDKEYGTTGSKDEEVEYTAEKIVFKEDGTVEEYYNGNREEWGTPYRYSGGHIYYFDDYEDGEWVDQGRVLVLTDEVLVIEYQFKESDWAEYEKITYRKEN